MRTLPSRPAAARASLVPLALALAAATAVAGGRSIGDFDGDGFDDLVVGVPDENLGAVVNAGVVHVLYGAQGMPAPLGRDHFFRQGLDGVPDGAEENDLFGAAWAAGDFDHDGIEDLAIGSPGENGSAGMVVVLYGRPVDGLTTANLDVFTQDTALMQDTSEPGDRFGAALAAGDFNEDGWTDLAVGVPGEDLNGIADAGAVAILLGSNGGLNAFLNGFWHQDLAGVDEQCEADDEFGRVLAAGDFDGDGAEDLAVGVPDEDIEEVGSPTRANAGAVQVLFGGGGAGLTSRDQLWHQNLAAVAGESEDGDHFGESLAAGEFTTDLRDDLAIGVPDEDTGAAGNAGCVILLAGGTGGLVVSEVGYVDEDSSGVPEDVEPADRFGQSLAIGDLDGDGRNDLVVGAPGEDIGSFSGAGAVFVMQGRVGGIAPFTARMIHKDIPFFADAPGTGDGWGEAVQAGDFGAGPAAEIAIGVPNDDNFAFNHGTVRIVTVPNDVFGWTYDQGDLEQFFYHQDLNGMPDSCEDSDHFGEVGQGG